MGISVAVVNYRTPEDLKRFLESYDKTAPAEASLVVVDVDPNKNKDFDVPRDGLYIETKTNIGYGRACNAAVKHRLDPDADVYAFFNADVVLLDGTIEKCAEALRQNEDWGVLGPYQYDTNGKVTHGGIIGDPKRPFQRGWHRGKSDDFKEALEAVMVMGSAFFVKRQCWDELFDCPILKKVFPKITGNFMEGFLYYEETMLSYHARAHGWKNIYYGPAECIHEWHKSIEKYGDRNAFPESRRMFREFCRAHNIEHD